MNTATELLRWIYDDLERDTKLPLWLRDRVRDFLTAEPEAEPLAYIYKGFGIQSLNFITDDLKPHLHGEEISLLYLTHPNPSQPLGSR
jgi:hypothetical protein